MSLPQRKFDFWQEHSLNYLKMAFSMDRREKPKDADAYGKRTGICGDTVEFFLSIQEGRIQSVSFDITGCINTNACANTVAYLAEGKKIEDAWKITPDDVINFLKTLPSENYHCAELAAGAFYLALSDNKKREHHRRKQPCTIDGSELTGAGSKPASV